VTEGRERERELREMREMRKWRMKELIKYIKEKRREYFAVHNTHKICNPILIINKKRIFFFLHILCMGSSP
jgi:hypothetical protein